MRPMRAVTIGTLLLALSTCGAPDTSGAVKEEGFKSAPRTLFARGMRACRLIDGRAACWGSNVQGGLRPDAPPALRAPIWAPFEGELIQVLPLEAATCALSAEGAVRCVGIHPRSILATEELEDVVQIEGGRGYACAVHEGGGVSCWGVGAPASNRRHERFRVEGIDDAVQLAAGTGFLCALKRDGNVACWGDNRMGQLGDGTRDSHDSPAPIAYDGGDAVQIAAGAFHACLRTSEGQVRCWGRNDEGQVDGEGGDVVTEPTVVPELAASRGLAAGGNSSCAITEEGAICWGSGACGQRGVTPQRGCPQRRSPEGDRAPRVVLGGSVDELAMGKLHVCARRGEEVLCWGADDVGQLGRGRSEGLTRGGTCHPRAALCASEEPAPVLDPVDGPEELPLGEGIAWQPPLAYADAPRPPTHEVRFEVFDPEGFDAEALGRILSVTMRMPVLSCYRRIGPEPGERVFEATITEQGDEIPEVEVEDLSDPFVRCVRATFARGYYSVSGEGSFRVRATFTPDGWDGTI